MAYIKQPRTQIKTGRDIAPITLDGGVNRDGTIFNINPNQAWDSINTTSKIKGALSVRPADTAKVTKMPEGTKEFIDTASILGINSYIVNYGTSAGVSIINLLVRDPDDRPNYYVLRWNPPSNTFWPKSYSLTSNVESTIISLQTGTEDYTIVCNEEGVYEDHGSGYTLISDAPKTPIYTYDDNRLFALEGNKLSWCDPFDITNWTTGDSGNVTITEMRGEGSALITMNDAVYCFSGDSLHILYGDDTGNYFLSNTIDVGCVGFRALAKYNNSIYFLNRDGIKVYSNGVVNSISDKINYWITNSQYKDSYANWAMAIDGDYLYLSLLSRVLANGITIELNLKTGVFNIWDEGYTSFAKIGLTLYGVRYTGLVEIGTNTSHTKEWYHETPMRRSQFNKQTISSIPVLVTLPTGSTLKVAYNTNDTTPSWTDLYTFTPSDITQEVIIDVPRTVLNNNMMYQLKFYGTGPCTIHEIGSDGRVIIR